jgi:hypothetical protein
VRHGWLFLGTRALVRALVVLVCLGGPIGGVLLGAAWAGW